MCAALWFPVFAFSGDRFQRQSDHCLCTGLWGQKSIRFKVTERIKLFSLRLIDVCTLLIEKSCLRDTLLWWSPIFDLVADVEIVDNHIIAFVLLFDRSAANFKLKFSQLPSQSSEQANLCRFLVGTRSETKPVQTDNFGWKVSSRNSLASIFSVWKSYKGPKIWNRRSRRRRRRFPRSDAINLLSFSKFQSA